MQLSVVNSPRYGIYLRVMGCTMQCSIKVIVNYDITKSFTHAPDKGSAVRGWGVAVAQRISHDAVLH